MGWCELGRLKAQIYYVYGDFSVRVKRETGELVTEGMERCDESKLHIPLLSLPCSIPSVTNFQCDGRKVERHAPFRLILIMLFGEDGSLVLERG